MKNNYRVLAAKQNVLVATPQGSVAISWRDLRAAAQDYGDGYDETVSEIYRRLLADARSIAQADRRERVEVEGMYQSPMYAIGTAPKKEWADKFAASVERDYDLDASVLDVRVVAYDPDEVSFAEDCQRRQRKLHAEIDAALGAR